MSHDGTEGQTEGCEGAVGRPWTWPRAGGRVWLLRSLIVCVMASLSTCQSWWLCCFSEPAKETLVRVGRGFRDTKPSTWGEF